MSDKKNLNILVTGAAGFIGSHLVDQLLIEGHTVVGLDNLRNGKLENIEQAQAHPNFTFVNGDILNKADVSRAIEGIDVVYHLACLGVRHSLHSPFENHRVNAEGTLNVLEAALKVKTKHFYYISTSEIYGKTISFPIKETDPTLPITVYGSSKLAGEHYTNSYYECYGMNTTVLRIFNNYGPRAHYEGDCGEVIPRSIVRIIYGENPIVFGDGEITRDFFFVKDTARILTGLLNCNNLSGSTINVGTGKEITMKALLERVIELMPDYKASLDFLDPRPADVPRLWVDNSKLNSILQLDSYMKLNDGLLETINYYVEMSANRNLINEVELTNWSK